MEYIALRVSREANGLCYTKDVYTESKVSEQLGLSLRLIGGWRGGDDGEPESVSAERRRHVPHFLLGFPIAQCPKVVRYLFFVDTNATVMEADLVASHLRVLVKEANRLKVECKVLEAYTKTAETVKVVREEEAWVQT